MGIPKDGFDKADPVFVYSLWYPSIMRECDKWAKLVPAHYEDSMQEARIALWLAIQNCDKTRPIGQIHSYCKHMAVGAIRHYLRDKVSLIRIPARLFEKGVRIKFVNLEYDEDEMF